MTFDATDLQARIRLGEDARWEFKEVAFRGNRLAGPSPNALADELAAFANGRGGVLLLGVTDSGDVQGMMQPQLDELERIVVDVCRNKIKPSIEADIRRHLIEPDRPVLTVDVEAGYAQHESPGGAYRRIGSSKERMSPDDRLRLAQQRSQACPDPPGRQRAASRASRIPAGAGRRHRPRHPRWKSDDQRRCTAARPFHPRRGAAGPGRTRQSTPGSDCGVLQPGCGARIARGFGAPRRTATAERDEA